MGNTNYGFHVKMCSIKISLFRIVKSKISDDMATRTLLSCPNVSWQHFFSNGI